MVGIVGRREGGRIVEPVVARVGNIFHFTLRELNILVDIKEEERAAWFPPPPSPTSQSHPAHKGAS